MPEERALHVLGLVVDLRVERDVVAAGAGLVAARRVRGEADAGAEIFGECLLFFVAEADAREHHDAVSLDQFDALRPKRLVENVGAINMDDGANGRFDRFGFQIHDGISSHAMRSEEHTSELQSLMRISYAVFCLKKKKNNQSTKQTQNNENLRFMHKTKQD